MIQRQLLTARVVAQIECVFLQRIDNLVAYETFKQVQIQVWDIVLRDVAVQLRQPIYDRIVGRMIFV